MAGSDARPIVVELSKTPRPVPALADIWEPLRAAFGQIRRLKDDDAAVRERQHAIIRNRALMLPSPHGGPVLDACFESYFSAHRVFYRFQGEEEYFWISGALDSAFAPCTIYFPARRVALTIEPEPMPAELLADFERLRAAVRRPARGSEPPDSKCAVVTGHTHYMHVLWNELPALERAAAAGLAEHMQIAAMYQPLGPLAELFPEFAPDLRLLKFWELKTLSAEQRMVAGLSTRTITRGAQERLRAVALDHTDPRSLAERDRFREAHWPIFWFSVKPPGRTIVRQAEILAYLIAAAKQAYPSAGFILNGTSRPWDLEANENYGSWFMEGYEPAALFCRDIIAAILDGLPSGLRRCVRPLSDIGVCEEVSWGAIVDFYFCHGGTMQNKIGWIHQVPGMVHAPLEYIQAFQAQAGVVESGPPCHFVQPHLVAGYGREENVSFGQVRRSVKYGFTSLDELACSFLKTAGPYLDRPLTHRDERTAG